MQVDRNAFLLAVCTLAAGGAGGYYASQSLRSASADSPRAEPGVPAAPPQAQVAAPPVAPACDDGTGSPAACPVAVYPSEEGGGCAPVAAKRCAEFVQTMKPRIAERAVSCINALTPAQRCDRARVDLCGHTALMSACAPPDNAATTTDMKLMAEATDVTSHCETIAKRCGGTATGPSQADCRATLSGMTSAGRDRMVECVAAHCADKGLLGCEAVTKEPVVAARAGD